eukprot:SAG31_NODE_7082_length_1793_cov_17.163518_1_plen_97_part_00
MLLRELGFVDWRLLDGPMAALPFYSPIRDPTARLLEYDVRYDESGPTYIDGTDKSVLTFAVGLIDLCRWITSMLLGHIFKVLIETELTMTVDGGWV